MGVLFGSIFLTLLVFNLNFIRNDAQKSSVSNLTCQSVYDCSDSSQVCINNVCKCGPNKRWNSTLQKCELIHCQNDRDCQELDENQACNFNFNSCICGYGYTLNETSNICEKFTVNNTIKNECNYNSDCQRYGDSNQVCVDNLCECQPNYKWDAVNTVCTHFYCLYNNDCENYDSNRICSANRCICSANYHENSVNKKCIYDFVTTNTTSFPTTLNPIEKYCTDLSNCGTNQFCIKNRCECLPNYVHSFNTCIYQYCSQDSDCQHYDIERMCRKGICDCISPYKIDPKTKICNMTVEQSCNTMYDCGSNQFCINNLCECQPNYYYNKFSDSCRPSRCYADKDCNIFDKNRICSYNDCKCKSGYTIDPKTKICMRTVEKPCKSIYDCGQNQFCVNNLCECQPNYVFSNVSNSCIFKSCNYYSDCNQFDTKRICSDHYCDSCNTYYAIDPISKLCNTTVGFFCTSNYDCTKYGDDDQVCVDNSCQCKPDHRMDTSGDCSYYSCNFDSDCQIYDNNRVCEYGSCECYTSYRADNDSLKCIYYSVNFWWLWMLLIIPMVFIILCVLSVRKRRATQIQQSATSITSASPIMQSNQFLTNSSQHVTFNDPPPPYSR